MADRRVPRSRAYRIRKDYGGLGLIALSPAATLAYRHIPGSASRDSDDLADAHDATFQRMMLSDDIILHWHSA
jgi:hypothetical protein